MPNEQMSMVQVLTFDGIDDYVSLPPLNPDFAKGITIEAWVKWYSFKHYSRIIELANGTPQDNIVFSNTATTRKLLVYAPSGYTETPELLDAGQWIHLAATVNVAGSCCVYKNGQLVHSATAGAIPNVLRRLNFLGKSNWATDGYFHGQMADVRIWNVVRTQSEIDKGRSRRLTGKEPGLVLYWPMNEGTGTQIKDLGAGGVVGTISGATWQLAEVSIGPAVTLPGPINWWGFVEQSGKLAADSQGGLHANMERLTSIPGRWKNALRFSASDGTRPILLGGSEVSGPWTVSAWIRRDKDTPGSTLLGSDRCAIKLEQWGSKSKLGVTRYGIGDWSIASGLPLGSWAHLAVVGSASDTKFYVNGVLAGSIPQGIALPRTYLGSSAGWVEYLEAALEDLRIYNQALTAEEIKELSGRPAGVV